jgi:hypothetical protein
MQNFLPAYINKIKNMFILMGIATQKLLAAENYPMKTLPEAAPTQNLLPA